MSASGSYNEQGGRPSRHSSIQMNAAAYGGSIPKNDGGASFSTPSKKVSRDVTMNATSIKESNVDPGLKTKVTEDMVK